MEIRHLQLIKALAEKGSLTAATKVLFLTQPALSRQLRTIEDEFGLVLFQRVGRKMIPTQAGQILYQGACRIIHELEKTVNDVNALYNGQGGTLRLVTACYTCYHWLPAILEEYKKKFPNVKIKIRLTATADPYTAMLNGELDLALVNRIVSPKNLKYQALFEDEDIAIVRYDHHWAKRKFISPKNLAAENLIVFDGAVEESNLFQKILMPAGIVPKEIITLPMTDAIIDMVSAGLGITVMVKWAALPYFKSARLVPISLTRKGVRRTWYAVTPKDPGRPKYIQGFVDLLKEQFQSVSNRRG
jgi:LysR family transcriptional regulator for metE and metH